MKYIYALLISLFLPTVVFAQSVPVSWLRNVASGFLTPLNINDSVGIGTVSPQNKLEISGTSAGATLGLLRLSNIGMATSTGARLLFTTKDSGNFNLSSTIDSIATDITTAQGKSDLVFSVTNVGSLVERMRILSSGNVGIGSTTPVSQLTVQKTLTSETDYPALALSRDDNNLSAGDSLGDIDFWSNDGSFDGPGIGSRIRGVSEGTAGRSYGLSLWTRSGDLGTPISEKMRITSTGNVGIGTTSPSTKLQVAASLTRYISFFDSNSTVSNIFRADDNSAVNLFTLENRDITATTGHGVDIEYRLANDTTTTAINAGTIRLAKENLWTTTASTQDSYFAFSPATDGNTTERMRIVGSTGNVGIGTTTPWTRLAVTGSTTIAGGPLIVLGSANTPIGADTDWYRGLAQFRKDINDYMYVTMENRNGGANASSDFIWNNDRTTSLTYYADAGFNSSGYNNPSYGNLNVPNGWYLYNTDGPAFIYTATTSPLGYIDFGTGGYSSSRMRITSTGNVGIGTTSPASLLSVAGTIAQNSAIARFNLGGTWDDELRIVAAGTSGTDPAIRLYRTNGVSAYNPYEMKMSATGLQFNTGSAAAKGSETYTTNTLALTTSGNVGIGTTTPRSTLSVGSVNDATNSYAQIDSVNGAPTAGDCDTDLERGRMIIDYSNNRFYICNGATRGWDYSALTD